MIGQDIGPLAAAVVRHLGSEWRVQPGHEPSDRYLAGTGREQLLITTGWESTGRVAVSGAFPVIDMPVKPCEITINAARGPEVIAREITRRLLPVYRQRLAEVTAHQDRERRQREARQTLAASIEALFGDAFTREGGHLGSRTETETVFAARCGARGSAETQGGADTVSIEIRQVPQRAALRILTTLAEEP